MVAVAGLLLMLILTYFSRRRFKRIKHVTMASHSPARNVERLTSSETFAATTTPDKHPDNSGASQVSSTALGNPQQTHS